MTLSLKTRLSAITLLAAAMTACTGGATISSSPEISSAASSQASEVPASSAVSSSSVAPAVSSAAPISSASNSSIAPLPPVDGDASAFEKYFRPIVMEQNCNLCHSEDFGINQGPMFAHSEAPIGERELVSTGKINFSDPLQSRIVQKVYNLPLHNCGTSLEECQALGNNMIAAIKRWREESGNSLFNQQSPLKSQATKLSEAFNKPSENQRDNTGVIALYDFVNCGATVRDESGVMPQQELQLFGGAECIENEGLRVPKNGYALATDDSLKVFDAISNSPAGYTIEAWFSPSSPDRASIVGMWADAPDVDEFGAPTSTRRNIDLGYNTRSSGGAVTLGMVRHAHRTGASGVYAIQNDSISFVQDETVIPGTNNHVAITVPSSGERIFYINGKRMPGSGRPTGQTQNWDSTLKLSLGRDFEGIIGLVAIYDRVIDEGQLVNNSAVLAEIIKQVRFDITDLAGAPSSIVMNVKAVGEDAYSFTDPVLQTESTTPLTIKGLNLSLNGQVAQVGQAFSRIDIQASNGDLLSTGSTLMVLNNGEELDEFALHFDAIGGENFTRIPVEFEPVAPVPDGKRPGQDGIRDFQRIVQTYALITGISTNQRDIRYLYDTIRPMLPVRPQVSSFNHTQQLSYTSLAMNYCEKMMQDDDKRSAFFSTFDIEQPVTGPNFEAMVADIFNNTVGIPLDYQITQAEMAEALEPLATAMQAQNISNTNIAIAACGSVLGSAVVTVQ